MDDKAILYECRAITAGERKGKGRYPTARLKRADGIGGFLILTSDHLEKPFAIGKKYIIAISPVGAEVK